jgi:hypothetical protein
MFAAVISAARRHGALDGGKAMKDSDKSRAYLGAYASGSLSRSEERRLHRAALDDQELFNELAQEELLREVFSDSVFRQRVMRRLRSLEERPRFGWAALFASWFRQPAFAAGAAMAAMVLAAGVALFQEERIPREAAKGLESAGAMEKGLVPEPETDSALAGTGRDGLLEQLWGQARLGREDGVELGFDRPGDVPRYAVGEGIRVRFSVPSDASVVLLAKGPAGVVTRLFPDSRHPSPQVRANEQVQVPSAEQDILRVTGPGGRNRLRLLVLLPEAEAVGRERALAVERSFDVVE